MILAHPLTNLEIQKYYENEPRFNGVYSRSNLPKIRDGVYIINLDGYSDIGTHWVALWVNNNNVTYFDSFGAEHVRKESLSIFLCPLLCKIKILKQIFSEYKHFDCIGNVLIVLSAISGGVSITSFTSIIGAPVGISSASFTLISSLTTGILKKLLNTTRKKKKKDDKILMLAKSKLNSVETLIYQALIDMEISHEEFITILNEKDRYEKIKNNLISKNEKSYEIMRLSRLKSKT